MQEINTNNIEEPTSSDYRWSDDQDDIFSMYKTVKVMCFSIEALLIWYNFAWIPVVFDQLNDYHILDMLQKFIPHRKLKSKIILQVTLLQVNLTCPL